NLAPGSVNNTGLDKSRNHAQYAVERAYTLGGDRLHGFRQSLRGKSKTQNKHTRGTLGKAINRRGTERGRRRTVTGTVTTEK
ncbi:TPA: hypothetical protein ACWMIZ_005370, partial [Escherichia coli]